MTVGDLVTRMTVAEVRHWITYLTILQRDK